MTLRAGSRLGPYEIIAPLGAGGMGEVYRARDTKLGRAVAVKVLPEALAADADRIARFEREAKVLASLNHPNIAALFGMEQSNERHLLIMELVEGDTLAERIKRGALPTLEALAIAIQIAEALEAAHEQGIVHRDLKPANVKITPDDKVKVLDFGLAKAMETAPAANTSHSPTLSMMATQAGIILGTAAYMSPEQAKGYPADQRSDVFSFGAVLYEMLTGRPPFQGDTAPEVMANVLVRDADFTALPASLHPRLHDLVARCLQKQPKKRWQAIGDVRAELEAIAAAPHPAPVAVAMPKPLWKRALPAIAAGIATAIVTAIAGRYLDRGFTKPPAAPAAVAASIRFTVTIPDTQRLTASSRNVLALSPDGTKLVYTVRVGPMNSPIMLRALGDFEARPIAGTTNLSAVFSPVFSPDGNWVAFWSGIDQSIRKVPLAGGTPVRICTVFNPSGISWSDDTIVYGLRDGVWRVSANGGEPERIVSVDANHTAATPQLLNGGRAVLYTRATQSGEDPELVLHTLETNESRTIIRSGHSARLTTTGHLVYMADSTLFAVAFDPVRGELSGGPVPVAEGVMAGTNTAVLIAQFAIAGNGTLAFVPGTARFNERGLAIFAANGAMQQLPVPPARYMEPRFSPKATELAFATDDGKDSAVWIYDLTRNAPARRLTFAGRSESPIWSPDGRFITFQSDREGDRGIFRQPADGSGRAEPLTTAKPDTIHKPESWSPDGKVLAFSIDQAGRSSIWSLTIGDRSGPKPLVPNSEPHSQTSAAFSPDGRWLAYGTNELGRPAFHILVRPFPLVETKYQMTTTSTSTPVWSRDGKRLYYAYTSVLYSNNIQTTRGLTFDQPTQINFDGILPSAPTVRHFDVGPEGKVVAVLASATAGTRRPTEQINVVINWGEELKSKAATK